MKLKEQQSKNSNPSSQTTKGQQPLSNKSSQKSLLKGGNNTTKEVKQAPPPQSQQQNWYEEFYAQQMNSTNERTVKSAGKTKLNNQSSLKIDSSRNNTAVNFKILQTPNNTGMQRPTSGALLTHKVIEANEYSSLQQPATIHKPGHIRKYSGQQSQYTVTSPQQFLKAPEQQPMIMNQTMTSCTQSLSPFNGNSASFNQQRNDNGGASKSLSKNIQNLSTNVKKQSTQKVVDIMTKNQQDQQQVQQQFYQQTTLAEVSEDMTPKSGSQNIIVQYQYNNFFYAHQFKESQLSNQMVSNEVADGKFSQLSNVQYTNNDRNMAQALMLGGKNNSQTLSDKLESFNKHKLMVKNQPSFMLGSTYGGSENLQQLRSQSEDRNALEMEQGISGFFHNMNKQKAIDSAYSFFHKMQTKVRDLVSSSPKVKNPNPDIMNLSQDCDVKTGSLLSEKAYGKSYNSGSAAYKKSRAMMNTLRTPENQRIIAKPHYPLFSENGAFRPVNKNNAAQKHQSIKPSEKLADDPIDPPSPRSLETLCLNCQQHVPQKKILEHQQQCSRQSHLSIESQLQNTDQDLISKIDKLLSALDKYIKDQPHSNSREEMHAASLQLYASKLKDEVRAQRVEDISPRDYESFKELVQNIQFQEESGGASTNMLLFIQRLKVLCRERLNIIIKHLKANNVQGFKIEANSSTTSSVIRGGGGSKRMANEGNNQNSIRDDISEDRLREKMDEVSKTIKEKEFLQKRTNDLLQAINQKTQKKLNYNQDPNIIHKGQCLINDLRSDIDNQTYVSDGSSKTQISQVTTSTMQQANLTSLMVGLGTMPSNGLRSPSDQMRSMISNAENDEIDETLSIQNNKREKEIKQKHKIQFYEISFHIKKTVFPESHLAKYANIPALYDEAQKRQIQPDKYQDFIYTELSKNAQLWVSMKEINQIRKKSQSGQSSAAAKISQSNSKDNLLKAQDYSQDIEVSLKNYNQYQQDQQPKRGTTNSTSRYRGNGNKNMKIETIVEEDDAQLLMYND